MNATGFGEIAESVRRASVVVRTAGHASGSGVVWNAQGLIVTNAHVIGRGPVAVETWDGQRVVAEILDRDSARDLALLRAERDDVAVPAWGDSSLLRPGDLLVAVGNPLGFVGALSTGIVHALGPVRGLGPRRWVQANIRLAPGNSGGALANARGEIVGVNSMIAGGMGLAIPSNEVRAFAERALRPQRPPVLGVEVEPVSLRLGKNLRPAWRIQRISPRGRAEQASLLVGDVIIGTDGKQFEGTADLSERLSQGGLLELEFLRGGRPVPRVVAIPLDGVGGHEIGGQRRTQSAA